MKVLLSALFLVLLALPVFAADAPEQKAESWLKPVKAPFICMMNDKAFDREQLPVKVGDRTYYGCCPMCKEMLQKDASKRSSVDPVSGKTVDKATAVIGADTNGKVYYFENEKDFQTFASGPMPEMHKDMGGMMQGMMGKGMTEEESMGDSGKGNASTAAPETSSDHEKHHPVAQ